MKADRHNHPGINCLGPVSEGEKTAFEGIAVKFLGATASSDDRVVLGLCSIKKVVNPDLSPYFSSDEFVGVATVAELSMATDALGRIGTLRGLPDQPVHEQL